MRAYFAPVVATALFVSLFVWAGVCIFGPAARRQAAVRRELGRLWDRGWIQKLWISNDELACVARETQSQHLEDLRILEMLLLAARHEGNRTYVEIGAFDGKTYSNTWMLERCFGWRGLLIEGSPENFLKLKANRPRNNVLRQLAVCPAGGDGYVNFSSRGSAVSGDAAVMSGSFKRKWAHAQGASYVRVPCQPLSQIMREAGMPTAAFLSLDVEGAEHKVVSTVDPAAFRAILVEMDGHDPPKDFRVHKAIVQAGLLPPFRSLCRERCGGKPVRMEVGGNEVYLAPSLMAEHTLAAHGAKTEHTLAPEVIAKTLSAQPRVSH